MSEAVSVGDEYASGPTRESLELERLALENDKLRAELSALRRDRWHLLQQLSPLLGGLLALAGFLFGVVQYVEQQQRNRAEAMARADEQIQAMAFEAERQAEARDQEFMKPLWEREIATYFRAAEVVATLAAETDPSALRAAEEEFWVLYLGPLVVIETQALSGAMKSFGECLNGTDACSRAQRANRALAVSSAIQGAIEEHAALRLSEFSQGKYQYHR
jgi:hypothetical protein